MVYNAVNMSGRTKIGETIRTNLYLGKRQVEWLDAFVKENGYSNRSELIRRIIDMVIEDIEEVEDGE